MKRINPNVLARYFLKYSLVALAVTVATTTIMRNAIEVAELVEVNVRPGSIQIKIDNPSRQGCLQDYPLSKDKKA